METRESHSSDAIKAELVAQLKLRSPEFEDAMVARVRNSELSEDMDPESIAWLRPAVAEAVARIVAAVEEEEWSPPLSPAVVAFIRSRARHGVSLESILRGFSLGGNVFVDFIAEELADLPQAQETLRYAVNWLSRNNDQLMNAFATEYQKEVERINRSPDRRLAERVTKLLEGGKEADADLDYRLNGRHIGLIAVGAKANLACRRLAERLGCDLLLLPRAENTVWAWLGARRQLGFSELEQRIGVEADSPYLAVGEPRDGIEGWRLTHREALAALRVALLEGRRLTRYSDVALLGAALDDETACRTLLDRYLEPLDRHRNGERLRETVGTYLDLDCNAASTASALGVNRHTVQRRLKKVEEAIGEPLSARRAELDVALRLEQLTARAAESGASHDEN